ncbi:MAG: hemolysin family protein [Lachnospiraceae bacterium]|nr:hemolysin family protein [Lachnospiraceae bacterium]
MTLIIIASIGVLACIIFSAFFSGSEMAYSSCNRTRLDNLAEDGNKRAKLAAKIVDKFDDTLSTILIGNNLVNIAASSLGTVLVIKIWEQINSGKTAPTWLSTLVLTILIIVFGETIPKITAKKAANRKALKYVYIINVLKFVLTPVVIPVVGLVKLCSLPLKGEKEKVDDDEAVDELTDIIETAEEERVLDEDTSELVQAAIDFNDIQVSEVMTARVDVVAIDIEDDYEEIEKIIAESSFTRIPVYEGSIDKVIGILSLNRFLRAALEQDRPDIRALLMPARHVYKTTKLPLVLNELRRAKQHLAIVTDEYGGTLGIVSMEDVLEQIVGDIWDETDEVVDEVVERADGRYELDGDTSIATFLETLELHEEALEEIDSETVGGWCIETLEHFPEAGESFSWRDYHVTIVTADELRVEKVLVEKVQEQAE